MVWLMMGVIPDEYWARVSPKVGKDVYRMTPDLLECVVWADQVWNFQLFLTGLKSSIIMTKIARFYLKD